jgi:hypothetical protein
MNHIVDRLTTKLQQNGIAMQIVEPLRTGVVMLEYMLCMGYSNRIFATKINGWKNELVPELVEY